MSILVLNAGSSTLKFALFDDAARAELASGVVDWRGRSAASTVSFRSKSTEELQASAQIADYGEAVAWILGALTETGLGQSIQAVGHRVVHGATLFRETTLIDERVSHALEQTCQLAPLHNPHALETITACRGVLPQASQIAVFDTAFFADLPRRAFIYPVPYQWYEQHGIRRFGFHGISHAYCAMRAAELLERANDASLRLVVCHLGNGCSATAVRGGQPVTTSMGFTPLEGLMMGTRSGSIDPSILLELLHRGFDAEQLERSLNSESGLFGVSGIASDFREVEQAADGGDERARLALKMFCDRVRSTIGAHAVTLGGVDALVYTAGIGEHSARLRTEVCDGLQCLGLQLDERLNQNCRPDCNIAAPGSAGQILVIRTREEQMIAHELVKLLSRGV